MKPLLPSSDKILRYLKRIDKERVYSNFGPLNDEYCERLGELFDAPVVTCSSATSGLVACLLALNLPKGSMVGCPSWTFVATPSAIVMAGHVPYFMDVGKDGIVIPSNLKLAALIVVSPCGAPLHMGNWDAFSLNTGIPIIIDAAAGFDTFSTVNRPRRSPVVISTHATKVFGTGEGGFISCHDKPLLEKIRRITNFGFTPERKVEYIGFNAKLSEYHAAIGLAELDGWSDKRNKYLRKTKIYGVNYAASLIPVRIGEGRKGVYGCHKHKAFKDFPRAELPTTEEMMRKVSFIPVCI